MNTDVVTTTVLFNDDARKAIIKGMIIVADAVGCTLGPKGKVVVIHKKGQAPFATKDGVTVSQSISLKDPIQRVGGLLIKQAAERTNEIAGDGTTTATILTIALIQEGVKLLGSGHDASDVVKNIKLAANDVMTDLVKNAKPIKTSEEIEQIATISANGDMKIGQTIADALTKVGRDGIVTVDDAKGTDTSLVFVEGTRFERGYLSPFFVNNNDKMHALYEQCRVLVTDSKINTAAKLIPLLEKISNARQPLLIIAEDVENEALQTLVLNRVKGNLPVIAVKAPGYGQYRDELLKDLCSLTGATLSSIKTGTPLETLSLDRLGTCKKVIVDAKNTTLIATENAKEDVLKRISELVVQLDDIALTTEETDRLRLRIAGLSGGVAIIRVGGATELEMIERKHRIEDALNATRAASAAGIVLGGGMALLRSSLNVGRRNLPGWDALISACEAPIRKIVSNAGGSPDVIVNQATLESSERGYDASRHMFCDMFQSGIIDPLKVSKTALENAVSIATTFLTLSAIVIDDE